MKTVKIRTSSFSTFELQATRGEDTSIDDTTVTPSKPSNGNNSGNNSYSDSDDSDDSGTQSTTYRRKKTGASGQWVQDAKAGGIAEQTVPGRRVSGSSWGGMA